MDSQAYAALASITKYWYLLLIALMLLSLIAVSVSEYKQKKKIKKVVGRFIGYLELKSDGTRIGLTNDNLIGSGSRADIIIESPKVAKNHALIYFHDGQMMLRPLYKDTRINSRKAIREHEIFTGDVVQFGDVAFDVHIKEEAAEDED